MIDARIAGIPCLIEVDSCTIVPPWKGPASTAPSDLDYYGYSEIEFTVCDRRGRPAPWLERKMSEQDRIAIEEEILASRRD